jgi:hypothetical protein
MPNHVTHRVTLAGSEAAIKKLRESVITHYPSKHEDTWDNSQLIYRKGDNDSELIGWLHKETGEFSRRIDGKETIIGNGVPEGWKPSMSVAFDAFDFEKIIPCPPCVFQGNLSSKDEEDNPGRNWLDWNRRKWGTKWNSYDNKTDEQGRFIFDTAWSFPEPVFIELSFLFPEVTISVECIDEGGNFWGDAMFLGGEKKIDRIVSCRSYTPVDEEYRKKLNKELRDYDEDAEETEE